MSRTITNPLSALRSRYIQPIQSSFDWDVVAREQVSKTRAETSAVELEQLIRQLPSNRHLLVMEGFLERWSEKSKEFEKLPVSLQSAFDEIPKNNTVRVIIESFISHFDPQGLRALSLADIEWICQSMNKQMYEAGRLAQIAGPAISLTELSYRLKTSLVEVQEMVEQDQILYFKAFDWFWVPEWQLNTQNDDNIVFPIVSEIIDIVFSSKQLDKSNILYWAIRPCPELKNQSPAQWIKEGNNQQELLVSLQNLKRNVKCLSSPNSYTYSQDGLSNGRLYDQNRSTEILDPIRVRRVTRLLADLKTTTIFRQAPKFISAISTTRDFPPTWLETGDDLIEAGRVFVNYHLDAYPYKASMYQILHNSENKLLTVDEVTDRWLGKAMARKTRDLAILIESVGERLTRNEVTELLDITEIQLYRLEEKQEVISFRGSDYHWYPRWQFDLYERHVRPIASRIIQEFTTKDVLGAFEIASWATRNEWDWLMGNSPAQWIEDSKQDNEIVLKAVSDIIRDMDV